MFLPLWYYTLTGVVNCSIALGLCVTLALHWKRSSVIRMFFWFCFSVGYWSFFYIFFLSSKDVHTAEFYLRLCMIGVFFMPSTFLGFVFAFLNKARKSHRIFVVLNYLLSVFFTLVVYTRLYVTGMGHHLVFSFWPKPGILFHFIVLHFGVIFSFCFFMLYCNLKKSAGITRNQIIYILLGIMLGVLGGSTNYFCWYRMPIPPFLNILVFVFLSMVVYAIIKYSLMDIRLVVSRVIIFFLVYVPLLISPVLITHFKREDLERSFDGYYWLVPAILEGIFAIGGLFAFLYFQNKAEQRLLQKEYRHAEATRDISNDLARIEDIDSLAKTLVEKGKSAADVNYMALYIVTKDRKNYELKHYQGDVKYPPKNSLSVENKLVSFLYEKKERVIYEELDEKFLDVAQVLKELGGVIAIPSFLRDKLIAIIILGEKKNERLYSPIELMAFKVLANQTAFAIELILFKEILHKEKMLQAQDQYQKNLLNALKKMVEIAGLDELAKQIVEIMCKNIEVKSSSIYLYDTEDASYKLKYSLGISPEENIPRAIKEEEYFVKFLHEREDMLLYNDLKQWAVQSKSSFMKTAHEEARKLKADVIVPIIMSDRLLGFIVLGERTKADEYSASDWNTINLISSNAAMAIQNKIFSESTVRDTVTGIYNHGYFQARLNDAVAHAIRTCGALSCLFIDIDKFKHYNDTYGHQEGNSILLAFSEYLKGFCRVSDVPCRYGGDEFAMILPDTGLEDAKTFAERLRTQMKSVKIIKSVTVSIGVSCFTPGETGIRSKKTYDTRKIKDQLIDHADQAVYRAKSQLKENGEARDQICFSEPLRLVETLGESGKRTVKILLIEDEKKIIREYINFFQVKGCEIEIAETGKAGVLAFEKDFPDVVLLDLGLPDMDGREVFRKIYLKNPSIPIGIVSGFGDRKKEMLDLGANKFFLKPLKVQELYDWVIQIVA